MYFLACRASSPFSVESEASREKTHSRLLSRVLLSDVSLIESFLPTYAFLKNVLFRPE